MYCNHKWKITHGLTKAYKDCELCGCKWEDKDKVVQEIGKHRLVYSRTHYFRDMTITKHAGDVVELDPEMTFNSGYAALHVYSTKHYPALLGECVGEKRDRVLIYSEEEIEAMYETGAVLPVS